MVGLMTLLFLIVMCYKPAMYVNRDIHGNVSGNLYELSEISFVIFAKEFRGVILYCFDFNRNQFGLRLETYGQSKKDLLMNFNNKHKREPLDKFCGCVICDETRITFYVRFRKTTIDVQCNNNSIHTLLITDSQKYRKDQKSGIQLYSIPMAVHNGTELMYIMIGNIGPYKDENNKTVVPLKEPLIGCLDSFKYNKNIVPFTGNGTNMQPSCNKECLDRDCNGGVCHQIINNSVICNCSSTPFNGQYCNRSLITYIYGANNSYWTTRRTNHIFVKMTWQQTIFKRHCLMEIIGKTAVVTLSVNENKIMLDSKIVINFIAQSVNFIRVTVANSYLTMEINGILSQKIFSLEGSASVNVGFSRSSNNVCAVFEGQYDIVIDVPEVQQIGSIATWNQNQYFNIGLIVMSSVVLGAVLIVISIIFIVVAIIVLPCKRRQKTIPIIDDGQEQRGGDDINETRMSNFYNSLDDIYVYDSMNNTQAGIDDYVPMFPTTTSQSPPLPPRNT